MVWQDAGGHNSLYRLLRRSVASGLRQCNAERRLSVPDARYLAAHLPPKLRKAFRYADSGWGIDITVPKGATGVVAVYAYDREGVRKQTVTFQDREPAKLDDFSKGAWVE